MPELREFPLPDLGEGLLTAEIVRWFVGVGDRVADGTPVCEVETAKATVELPVPFDGVIHEIRAAEGATVDVGAPIVVVSVATAGPAPLVGYGATGPSASRWAARRAANGVPPAKPPVRRLARDLGVDLAGVRPTGPDRTVTRADVHSAAATGSMPLPAGSDRTVTRADVHSAAATGSMPSPAGPVGAGSPSVHKAMARAMVASAFTAPHASESITVDVTRTVKLVKRMRDDPVLAGGTVTPLLLVARALLASIARYPLINGGWDNEREEAVPRPRVNLGIAVTTERGLLVPNVKDAHALALPALATALAELIERARNGRTTPGEMAGGTVTVTNIGSLGVDSGMPILNPGEAAILAFGAIRRRPWVHKERLRSRYVTTLTLAFDHRVVDGALAARVLTTVASGLERPDRLVAWG